MSIFPQQQIIRVSDRNQLNNSPLVDSLYEGAIVYSQDTNELYIKSNGIFQHLVVGGSSDFYDNDKEIKREQKRRRK